MRDMKRYREVRRVWMLNKYYRRMHEFRQFLGGKCAKCGSIDGLEIDHINPESKKFTIGQMWSLSPLIVKDELDKCQLLCAACHHDKTIIDKGQKPAKDNHGTRSCYIHWGCRCRLCVTAQNDYCREWKRKKLLTCSLIAEQRALTPKA